MALSNHERVGKGLELLKQGLLPYVQRELQGHYRSRWWQDGVEAALHGTIGIEAMAHRGSDEERLARMDIQGLLLILWDNWREVFQEQLGHVGRSYVSELREVRNRWAHQQPFTVGDAHRALDTMARLLEMIGAPEQNEVRALARALLRQRYETETRRELRKSAAITQTGVAAGLRPWREIATPHPDVASGRYRQAEFAADLFQVLTGKAEAEYQDPVEFFHRTYLTEGLTRLLSQAWARLAGVGGDPVVELQTNFGGGKTHSMLALYHLFGGGDRLQYIDGLETLIPPQLQERDVVALPRAHRAVLVGTQLSPASPRQKPDGTVVHTLWGEVAWQLGDAVGKGAEAYALVAEEDRRGVSPGSETLTTLFERYGPALVLIDEWVAYARQLYGVDSLPAGSFDANMTFAQALTEAAKAARNALVVAAIPASDIEIGGEGGRAALERIQNVFGRLESPWKPASALESFEIVRRRLFQPIEDFAARDAVCRAFADLYRRNRADFPTECRETAYEERLRAAYPIHPELFDRLYEDWSTLERFQRTRGVLRLMAAIIYDLWMHQDGSLLIMPGTLPLADPGVRSEVMLYLSEGWGPVLDKDVDGPQSRPLALDNANPNLGRYSACRRVARTIFIGSAPSGGSQRVRGVEEVRVKLGCVQPGESPAIFGDALRRLSEELTYLYSDASRYWFDTHPTINRIAADRAAQYRNAQVMDEIVRRLRQAVSCERGDFAGVHVAPASSADVPDVDECRLVILSPETPHRARNGASKAQAAAQDILERRGAGPRIYRNMLLFLAADGERLNELVQAVRLWMAWTSIQQEEEQLNLDASQRRQVGTQITKQDETIVARLSETYCHLLVPAQEGTGPVTWDRVRLQGRGLVGRTSKRLLRDEGMITLWSPATLRIELDRWLWQDQPHLSIKQLWQYLASYLYLPRLRDREVLLEAIRQGVGSLTWQDYFAYAAAVREDGTYVGLTMGSLPNVVPDEYSVLVKPEVAQRQRQEEAAKAQATGGGPVPSSGDLLTADSTRESAAGAIPVVAAQVETGPRRFHGSVELDPMRVGRDAGRIADEVLAHLSGLVGAKVTVTLEIEVEVPDSIPEDKVRIVSENANTLKFKSAEFDV